MEHNQLWHSDVWHHQPMVMPRPLDDLRAKLLRSKSSLWDLPGLSRDGVVAWADNAPVSWPGDRREGFVDDGGERPHDGDYARFSQQPDAAVVESLVAWYVSRFVPAAAMTEGLAWGVTVLPTASVLARVNVGMVETLVVGATDEGLWAFANVRASVIEAAREARELTLRDLFGDAFDEEGAADDGESGGDDGYGGPGYVNVGDDHVRLDFDSLNEVRRVLSLVTVARAARLLNASLLSGNAVNARRGHCPAMVDRVFPGGVFQLVV